MTAPARAFGAPLPRLLVVTADLDAARRLGTVARDLGAAVEEAREWPEAREPGADLVCVDEACPGASPAALAGLRAHVPEVGILWLTREPRGATAAAALAAGADDVLAVPLWAPEVRARLAVHLDAARRRGEASRAAPPPENTELQLAAYASQLEASQENLRDLYEELEAHTRDLQTLVSAQESLIPVRVPAELRHQIEHAVQTLCPGARVTLRTGEDGAPGPERDVQTVGGTGRPWRRAVLPLRLGGAALGVLEVEAPADHPFPHRLLDLLEVYATQAAQALQRSGLYEALSRGKDEWERTFDTISDTISILGPDLVIRRANWALAASVGKTPRDLVGRLCYQVLYGADEPCAQCPVSQALETGQEVRVEGRLARGSRFFDYRAYPLRDALGRTHAAIAYARDVTREEELARGLRQSEKLVSLGQIAAGIAHEINNPLTAASSYAQLLTLRLQDPKAVESAKRIQQGIDRIHRLVQNLVSFARPSEGSFYPVDLNEIVAATLSFSHYEVTRGDTRLVQDLQTPLPRVLGAKDQLEQLLVSLLTNARDAVAGRGTLTLSTRAQGNRVLLEVAD
ncbi:MAG: two-component system sensor histidine kinase NtrB, partial [Deferrisomatales bacterium]